MAQPRVSIITVVFNNARTIASAIESVRAQSYPSIEHIVVDGGSTDGTLEVLERYRDGLARVIPGPDRGIYDAMNKGLAAATGDIVGTLNSDDFYANPRVVETVVRAMVKSGVDAVWGDLEYVGNQDTANVVRRWKSSPYAPGKFRWGWMPPHPTFFVRRSVYERFGFFRDEFRIAADYELMLRFLEKNRVSCRYIPEVLVKMRLGGVSNRTIGGIVRANREAWRAWRMNGLPVLLHTIVLKIVRKLFQFVQ
jgi:glycosyltransferase involved in cell wall biosynthesis